MHVVSPLWFSCRPEVMPRCLVMSVKSFWQLHPWLLSTTHMGVHDVLANARGPRVDAVIGEGCFTSSINFLYKASDLTNVFAWAKNLCTRVCKFNPTWAANPCVLAFALPYSWQPWARGVSFFHRWNWGARFSRLLELQC